MERVLLEELTWPEVRELITSGQVDTVIIAVGSTEQHGRHLPLATDAILAQVIGEELARRLGKALLAPPIRVGCSEHHMAFPGTISLSAATLGALVGDYVASLSRHGFKNIVVVATHGGNFGPLAQAVHGLRAAYPQVNIVDYTDLNHLMSALAGASAEFGVSAEASGGHAGESETSLMLALRPDLVKMERAVRGYVVAVPDAEVAARVFAEGIGALSADGVLGDARLGKAEKGRVYLERFVEALVEMVQPRLR